MEQRKCVGYNDSPVYRKPRVKAKLTPAERRKRAFIKWYNKHIGIIILVAIVISIVAISAFITNKIITFKQNNTMLDFGREKCYTTYYVKYGDTLWDIAEDMCEMNPEYPDVRIYIAEVRELNKIHDIKSGDKITLPYYKYTNEEMLNKYNIE